MKLCVSLPLSRGLVCFALCIATGLLPARVHADLASADDVLFADMPVVLSATRLQQPQAEAPAAVTIIDRDMIRLSGARNLPEILRLVPGMQVGYEHDHQASISYHGVFDELAHRLQVLIDGRSVYEPALARILWLDLPLAIEDIQRIEITRGPNSALYGANSFNAVINIITLRAGENPGTQALLRHGDKNIRDSLLRYSGSLGEQSSMRVTLGARADDGFDITREQQVRHDGYDAAFLQAELDWQLHNGDRIDLSLGHKDGDKEIQGLDPFEPRGFHDVDDKNSFAMLHWYQSLSDTHALRWQIYANRNQQLEEWRSCPYRIYMSEELRALFVADEAYTLALLSAVANGGPLPLPSNMEVAQLLPALLQRYQAEGLATTCGSANQNVSERRLDAELQDSWRVNDQLRLVSGLSWRRDTATSETYFGRAQQTDLWRLFANAEYHFLPALVAHMGAMYEDDRLSGNNFSPRAALNWTFDNHHTLRMVWSRAVRTPDMFEEGGQFRYTVRDLDTPVNGSARDALYFQSSRSADHLQPERITSTEIGFFGSYFAHALSWDLKFFRDDSRDLVQGRTALAEFDLDNSGHALTQGVELELNWRPLSTMRLHLGASQLDLESDTAHYMQRSSPDYTWNLLAGWLLPANIEVSLSYYEMNEIYQTRYQLAGLRVAKDWDWAAATRLNLALDWRYRLDDEWFFEKDNLEADNGWYWLSAGIWF